MQNSSQMVGKTTPRVRITYDVQYGDTVEHRELPFVLGIFSDLAGTPETPLPQLRDRRFCEIDRDNFDSFLDGIAPRVSFSVPNRITDAGQPTTVDLRFKTMQDFDPGHVALGIQALSPLNNVRRDLDALRSAVHANDRLDQALREILINRDTSKKNMLPEEINKLATSGVLGDLEEEKTAARQWLETFSAELQADLPIASHDAEAILAVRIAAIDDVLSAQVSEVLHHPDFQRLEASWRGLEYLVSLPDCSSVKVRVLNVSKKDLLRDLQRASEFDQTVVFRKVYEEEYGIFGGQPFTVLIGDYEFGYHPTDIFILQQLGCICSAAATPFIGAVHPSMFTMDDFTQLVSPRTLGKIFDQRQYAAWKAFRETQDARFVGLVLPRVLLRLPYGREGRPTDGFAYEEGVDGREHDKYLWGTAVWAFAARLASAYARYGWYSAVSGVEGGGLVSGLPTHTFVSDEGDRVLQCPTEIAISDRRRRELEDLGFIPLCHEKGTNRAVFFAAPSCQKPARFDSDQATAAAYEAAKLENVFAASRFTHYIRCIIRDKDKAYTSSDELSRYLNSWIAAFVSLDENANLEERARFPLREGRVEIRETHGRPGVYTGIVFIKPHFLVRDMSEPLRFIVPLAR